MRRDEKIREKNERGVTERRRPKGEERNERKKESEEDRKSTVKEGWIGKNKREGGRRRRVIAE